MLQAGFEVDRYVVEEKLGEGGMAVVYRVRHATLGTRHALKVLSIISRDVRERLIQEGRVQATLRHPNVVAVTDVLDVNGAPGLLMEFVQGPALDHWLFNYKPSIEEALTVFRGIVAGVGHAHEHGLIHRDLKPANVMLHVDEDGIHPKVTDFGLAKISRHTDLKRTRTGTTMGTPAYMAPEQIRDASTVDRRADIYSLGCILYELICGRTPFGDDDIIELFARVAAGDYPHPRELRPDVPRQVVECIEALVEVNRDFRVSDCAAVIELLDGVDKSSLTVPVVIGGESQPLPPPRAMPHPGNTTISPVGPAADLARRFVREPVTVPPVPDPYKTGSLAPTTPVPQPEPAAIDESPVTAPLRMPTSPSGLSKGVVAALLSLSALVVVFAGITLVLFGTVMLRPGTTETILVPTLPDPPEPSMRPTPVVEPEAIAPPLPQPTVKPKPTVKPVDRPQPAVPPAQPAKPPPAPEPTLTAVELTDYGTFELVSEASEVASIRLIGEDGKSYPPNARIPPGTYQVRVHFTDSPDTMHTGRPVTIFSGGRSAVKCAAQMRKCGPR